MLTNTFILIKKKIKRKIYKFVKHTINYCIRLYQKLNNKSMEFGVVVEQYI